VKIAIQTLGCKVNQSESAAIEGILRNNNYEIVAFSDSPDVCIVNTCTVTAKSDYQSRQLIRRAAKSGSRVIATGCYAQLNADDLSKIEGIDLVVGNSEKTGLINYLQNCSTKNDKPIIDVGMPNTPLKPLPYYSNRSRAFLKIQDGCNFSCTYCTVPLARGKSRSLNIQHVLTAVDDLKVQGYKEIVITGIHIGSYGLDLHPKSSLLKILNEVTGAHPDIRFRLSSIEPQEFREEFLSLIKDGNLCPHLHIPLQSGSDKVLKLMNRGYSTEYYKQLINEILTKCPDISIGTDLITGFPDESAKDFDDTVKFIKELPLSYLHVFPYSRRPNTKAFMMQNHVSGIIMKSRVKILRAIGNKKKNDYMTKYLHSIMDVIVEDKHLKGHYHRGISDNYLRLFIDSHNLQPGQRIIVRVKSMTDSGLFAQALK
jgi:threonylcarbamoyladenosine tRNA methylthiotransferase MtaB